MLPDALARWRIRASNRYRQLDGEHRRRLRSHHPFLTDSDEPTTDADITHRKHAIIETVFADLIAGPLAHMPSGHFGANST